jgi:environmental stress-induced protein Ves
LRLLRQADYASRPWRNGRGISRDIASGAGWQLSLADIDRSGPFSDFTGSLRLFAVVAGSVVLHLSGGQSIACDAASPIVAFDGGAPPECEVVAGPARALNLVVPAGSEGARLERHALEPGGAPLPVSDEDRDGGGHIVLVFVQAGGVECRLRPEPGAQPNGALLAGASDSVIVREPGGRLLIGATGGGRAIALVATVAA